MENDKSKNIIIGLLIVIIIILGTLIVLFATNTISFNSNINNIEENENNTNASDNIETNINDNYKLEYNGKDVSNSEVEQIHFSKANSIETDYDFNIVMTLSGKVEVFTIDENGNKFNDYLNNISNVIDIIHFSIPGSPNDQLVYMLLDNGDVYYYKVGDSINKKYTAKKVENISKVKKLFIYNESKVNAGGNWELIAITEENKFISLNQQSV